MPCAQSRWIGLLGLLLISAITRPAPAETIDPASLPGIVLDDSAAEVNGAWKASTFTSPHVGAGYIHDENQEKGAKSVRFVLRLPAAGNYQVLLAYSAAESRSKSTPVSVHSADGLQTVQIDQRQRPPDGQAFLPLGVFRFEAGESGAVVVSTEGTEGYVTVDAVQLLPTAAPTGLAVMAAPTSPAATAPEVVLPEPQPPDPSLHRLSSAELDALLRDEANSPSPPETVGDEQFLRRLALDLIGRQPSPDELAAFLADTSPDKRSRAIDRWLASEEFGKNWANYWSDTIAYRTPPPELSFLDYKPFKSWLAARLNAGDPWDQIVRQIVAARGKVQDQPQATFVGFHEGSATRLAGETSRIFLGLQIQCAECHDHPFEDWKREQFHELAAFYGRVQAKAPDRDSVLTEVKDKGQGEYQAPRLDDPSQKGPPLKPALFVAGQSLDLGASDLARRGSLAVWLTEPANRWFAKAYTNRIWQRLMGAGFVEPVDNLGGGEENLVRVHAALSESFTASRYDVKEFFRLVMNSQAYQSLGGDAEDATAGTPAKLRGDQVFDSLAAAIALPNVTPPADKPTDAIRFPPPPKSTRDAVSETFGFDPSLPQEEVCRTLSQAMLMMNNAELQAQVNAAPESGTILARLLAEESDDEAAVGKLFLRTLARRPTAQEVEVCRAHVAQAPSRGVAFEDLLWGLLNSAEFTTKR